jgi:hypothetical protein
MRQPVGDQKDPACFKSYRDHLMNEDMGMDVRLVSDSERSTTSPASRRRAKVFAVGLLVLFGSACSDAPTMSVNDAAPSAVVRLQFSAGNIDYCAELADIGRTRTSGRLSCVKGTMTLDGKQIRATSEQVAQLMTMTKRVLDFEADYKALVKYQQKQSSKPKLRSKRQDGSLGLVSLANDPPTKEAFCATQRYLFDEAKSNWDNAFISYWGNLLGASIGVVSGAAGAIGGVYLGTQYIVQAETQENIMEQALIAMDATSENMEQAGC